MEIKINTKTLITALKSLNFKNKDRDRLSDSALIRAESGKITLNRCTTTDTLILPIKGTITTPGQGLLPIKRVLTLLETAEETTTLQIDRVVATINNNRLYVGSTDDYIRPEHFDKKEYSRLGQISPEALKHALKITKPFAGKNQTRPLFDHYYMDKDTLTMCTGHVLAQTPLSLPELNKGVIVDYSLQHIERIKTKDNISIYLSEDRHILKIDNLDFTYFVRTYIDEYPDLKRLIPEHGLVLKADRKKLLNAAKNLLAYIKASSFEDTGIIIRNGKQGLELSTTEEGLQVTVPVDKPEFSLNMCLNVEYLLKALKTIKAEEVTLIAKNNEETLIITDRKSYLYIIMAMMVRGQELIEATPQEKVKIGLKQENIKGKKGKKKKRINKKDQKIKELEAKVKELQEIIKNMQNNNVYAK